MTPNIFEKPEILLANAIEFLIQGQDIEEASILLLCDINLYEYDHYGESQLGITLTSNRTIYDLFNDSTNTLNHTICDAFTAILPNEYSFGHINPKVKLSDNIGENWRTELLEMIEGKRPLNQGVKIREAPLFTWEYLLFRAPVEVTIAKELDKYKVLFLPNCAARLGIPEDRKKLEADFLVCFKGKWGILEINGDTYHTNSAKDHNRSRLFKQHGIRVFEAYEASRCIREPGVVVVEFLRILDQNG